MKQVVTAFGAIACFAFLAWQPGQAQQPKTVSIQIVNLTGTDINVQGYTVVGKKGVIFQIKKNGGAAFEQSHGGATRYYTIADSLQPLRVQTVPVNVPNRNVVLKIMPSPTNPKMLIIVAE